MKALILGAVLFSGPATACTAFLIPPAAKVTSDEAGIKEWRKDRLDYPIAFPARVYTSKSWAVLIEFGGFDFTHSACEAEGFVVSKKSGLAKLWVKKDRGFDAVWGKTGDLIEVSYVASVGPSGSVSARTQAAENVAAAEHAAALVRDRMKNADFKPPDVETQQTFPADFDKVWSALIETLSDQQFPLETIDKASGLVTTKTMTDSRGETMVCATRFDEAHRTSLNLFVKKTDGGTRVKVNATFRAMRDDQAITCYSSGAIEKSLFDGIKKNL